MEDPKVRYTVLIVEDEVLIRMSSAATLEDAGFLVAEARSSVEALDILLAHDHVDVLLTDVRMPGNMSGLELISLVRHFHPNIQCIVMSGTTSAEEAYNVGAVAFLAKPYMAASLVRAVTDLTSRNFTPLGRAA